MAFKHTLSDMPFALFSLISLVASSSGDMFLLYYKQKLSYLLESATEEKVKVLWTQKV